MPIVTEEADRLVVVTVYTFSLEVKGENQV